jgi:hypothetical protein
MTESYRLKAVESIVFLTFVRLSNWALCRAHRSAHDQTASRRLKRLNRDKRNAVMALLADEEWSAWSDGRIAEACAVSDRMVAKHRAEMPPRISESFGDRPWTVPCGGTTYTMNTAAIGVRSAALTQSGGLGCWVSVARSGGFPPTTIGTWRRTPPMRRGSSLGEEWA